MKSKLLSCLLVSAALAASGADAPPPPATAPVPPVAPAAALVPNQVVYAQRLPAVSELTSISAAQGLAIEQIVQTPTQVTVVYKSADGKTNTVAYLLLSGTANAAPGVVVPTSPPPVVYYEPAPRVVYYDGYGPGYYYADRGYYWYPPVSLSLGFGFRGGGGYRGGFHRGR